MLTTYLLLLFSSSVVKAQTYYDVTTQPILSRSIGDITWYEATCNLGQFIVGPSPTTLRLVGNPATENAESSTITASPEADPDHDGDWTPDPAVACNHNSTAAVVFVTSNADESELFMSVIVLSNSSTNGMINMPGPVMVSTLPSPQVSWSLPSGPSSPPGVENISAAMDDQFLYVTYMSWGSPTGSGDYYVVISLSSLTVVNGPTIIPQPGTLTPAISNAKPTVTCNRWHHSTNNAMIAYTFQNTSGIYQPATIIPDIGPSSAATLVEPSGMSSVNCLWVRVVDFDNQSGTPTRHFFYAFAPNTPIGSFTNPSLWSTDASTVWGPITTNLVLYNPGGLIAPTYMPSPAVGDGYLNQSVYCDYAEWKGDGTQNLKICRQQGINIQLVANAPAFSIFSLGCNQMGIFIPFDDAGQWMWRAFWPFAQDIQENTLATGLTKVLPNVSTIGEIGVGVGTRTNLLDTLRINQDNSGAEDFQFAQNVLPVPPGMIALWAGEAPSSATQDVDNGNRGCIIMDANANVDFTNTPGVTFQARSDGEIIYNGAILNNENADLIGATGETRVGGTYFSSGDPLNGHDTTEKRRGIWYMNDPLAVNFSTGGVYSSFGTGGIYNGSTFGGVKGQVRFISTDNTTLYNYYLTISGTGSAMNFDSTYMYLGSTNTSSAITQIWAGDLGTGSGPTSHITFTNGIVTNLWQHSQYGVYGILDGIESQPNNPGSASLIWLNGVTNIDISNNHILYTQFEIQNPVTLVNFNFNWAENIQYLLWMLWTPGGTDQFTGQANILDNGTAGEWPFGGGSTSGSGQAASQTIIIDGFHLGDQRLVMCDDNYFDNRSTGSADYNQYNPNSTGVLIRYGSNVDVSNNVFNGYGICIDNQITDLSNSFYCNNSFMQVLECGTNGTGIVEEDAAGSCFPKLNWANNLALGYLAEGHNGSTLIANMFDTCTVGAQFQAEAVTIVSGSHTGPDNYAGFNFFQGNATSQVVLIDDGDEDAQPLFGLKCTDGPITGVFGENTFVAPSGAYHISAISGFLYQINNAVSENNWSPVSITNDPTHCHILLTDGTYINNAQYNDIGDGIATYPVFVCGGGYRTKGKGSSPQSVLDNTNPVPPSDSDWLYFEALPWIGVNNQLALDTLRLFIERFPNERTYVPAAINYTSVVVNSMAEGDSSYEYGPWIDNYNWLASIYTLDTARWFQSNILMSMAEDEEMFNRNESANLDWNLERLFPFDSNTCNSVIAAIRGHQSEIPEDTTPFHIIPIPPQPYTSSVAQVHIASDLEFTEMPNPVAQSLQVDIVAPYESPMSLILYDELGRVIRQLSSGRVNAGDNLLEFDISDIPSGSYYLRLAAANDVKTLSIVKQ